MINTDQKNRLERRWVNGTWDNPTWQRRDSNPIAAVVIIAAFIGLLLACYHYAMVDSVRPVIAEVLINRTPCEVCHYPALAAVTADCKVCHINRNARIKTYAGYKKEHPSPADLRLLKELEAK